MVVFSRFFVFSFLLSLLLVMPAVAADGEGFMITGLDHPESVAFDGTSYYISNVGKDLNPTAKDGDGYITRVSADGTVLDAKWATGLNAPKGLLFSHDRLWVVDVDQVFGYDLQTRQPDYVFSFINRRVQFDQQQVQFLNDIVDVGQDRLLVSGTDTGKLYRISLVDGAQQSFSVATLRGPNGLAVKGDTLYAVGFGDSGQANGPVVSITPAPANQYTITQVSSLRGNLDGVAVLGDLLFVSDWATGSVYQIPLQAGAKASPVLTGLSGPADFLLEGGKIWLPEMTAGRVIVKSFP